MKPFKRLPGDDRTEAQIREHYELEKVLAARLRNAPRDERRKLYGEVYDELYRKLAHHLRHQRAHTSARADRQVRMLDQFLRPGITVLEVGPGSCDTLIRVAGKVKRAIGLEVAVGTARQSEFPPNLELMKFDGINVPVAPNSVDLAYSCAVIEHLHPEDALDQCKGIAAALKPGGFFVFTTPHRYRGPDDISKYFDKVATGFHLKEYTFSDARQLVRDAGFSQIRALMDIKGRWRNVPAFWPLAAECGLGVFPYSVRRKLVDLRYLLRFFGVYAAAVK